MSDGNKKDPASTAPSEKKPTLTKRLTSSVSDKELEVGSAGAWFRGIAAAARKSATAARKVIMSTAKAKAPAAKQAVRAIGENRPLAFASEGAVAGQSMMPKLIYYGAWGLSGTAIVADIWTKQEDAPPSLKVNTALYWTAFHIPASLVVPAVIIHRIVHMVEDVVKNPEGLAKAWPPRAKSIAPVAAALLSIIPVVPVVDHTAEAIMEPTLGKVLGLSFDHHHGAAKGSDDSGDSKKKQD